MDMLTVPLKTLLKNSSDISRDHLLSEAACRADYFFRKPDGDYMIPRVGGQVEQVLTMLLSAHHKPTPRYQTLPVCQEVEPDEGCAPDGKWAVLEDYARTTFAGHRMEITRRNDGFVMTYLGMRHAQYFECIEQAQDQATCFAKAVLHQLQQRIGE